MIKHCTHIEEMKAEKVILKTQGQFKLTVMKSQFCILNQVKLARPLHFTIKLLKESSALCFTALSSHHFCT